MTMFSAIQYVRDSAYHAVYGYELNATEDNLKWAFKHSPEEVLKYTFREGSNVYTILEFAVKCNTTPSVIGLLEHGADPEHSPSSSGSILHFYMDCLKEDTKPNLEMLRLLLDHISDINVTETKYRLSEL